LGNRQPSLGQGTNRGRRVTTSKLSLASWPVEAEHEMSATSLSRSATVRLEEASQASCMRTGGYAHGDIPFRRWYVMDGGAGISRCENATGNASRGSSFWPTRAYFRGQRRLAGEPDDRRDDARRTAAWVKPLMWCRCVAARLSGRAHLCTPGRTSKRSWNARAAFVDFYARQNSFALMYTCVGDATRDELFAQLDSASDVRLPRRRS